MIPIKNVIAKLEEWAPLAYQEQYDNVGLLVGDYSANITGVLLTLDVLPEVVNEAKTKECNLIVAHHPIIFKGLKQLNGSNYVEKTVLKAIKADIAIYAIHTNLDNILTGVNAMISDRLGLKDRQILSPKSANLLKLTTMVPTDYVLKITDALADAGAGQIGNYSHCSFQAEGIGTFKPKAGASPFIGKTDQLENVKEISLTYIVPQYCKTQVVAALKASHPYEEPAYFLDYLANQNPEVGSGMLGQLPKPLPKLAFLQHLKSSMNLDCLKYTKGHQGTIEKVAVCGGAGSFLLAKAISRGVDAFISSDFKYHEFFDAEDQLTIVDIGHYESEVFTKTLLKDYLQTQFKILPLIESEINTNPIAYFK